MNEILKNSYNLIKNFRWNSIFFQYLRKLVPFFLIPFLIIYGGIYLFHAYSTENELEAYQTTNLKKSQNVFNNLFTELDKNFTTIKDNEALGTFLSLNRQQLRAHENYIFLYAINSLLTTTLAPSSYLDSIYLYSAASDYVTATKNSNPIDQFYNIAWYTAYRRTKNPNALVYTYNIPTHSNLISVSYGIYDGEQVTGIVVFNLDYEKLLHLVTPAPAGARELLRLQKTDGTVLFSTQQQELGAVLPYASFQDSGPAIEKADRTLTMADRLDNSLVLSVQNDIHTLRQKNLLSNAFVVILLAVMAVLIPLVISLYLSADFYRSISDIVVQLGYSGIDGSVTEGQKNELSYISQNIINMAANTKNIEQELVRKITQLKKSQAVALQTQLNPHFLFNTLNAVGLLYATDNPGGSDADILVRYLSDILDFSLNTKENIIPIRDEVFYTKRYIEIEKIKYQQDFCVIWDIDPALYDCKALKFILQPIVENAFEHGFRDDLGPGSRLEIAAAVQNSCLTFTVADNGHGMSPQRLEQIRGLLASDTLPESKNIGICNVSRRIQLVFGEQYGCSISSSPAGTTVQIRLPVI